MKRISMLILAVLVTGAAWGQSNTFSRATTFTGGVTFSSDGTVGASFKTTYDGGAAIWYGTGGLYRTAYSSGNARWEVTDAAGNVLAYVKDDGTTGTLGATGFIDAPGYKVSGTVLNTSHLADWATASLAAGHIPVWDGTDWVNKAVSGDATLASTGALTIAADAVALGTDTTGNYVGDVSAGSGIGVSGTPGEGYAETVALGPLTANWDQSGAFDVILNNALAELKILESVGDLYYGIFDIGDLTAVRTYTFGDETGTVVVMPTNGTLGDVLTSDGDGTVSWGTGGGPGSVAAIDDVGDVVATGYTAARILVDDGTDSWDAVAVSGDTTMAASGAVTIAADAVALPGDTTGTYVGDVSAGSGIGVSGTPAENYTETIALGPLTADWDQSGAFDVKLNNAGAELVILESAGATFYGTFDVGDLTGNRTYTFGDETGYIPAVAAVGSAGQVLTSDGDGTYSWAAAGGSTASLADIGDVDAYSSIASGHIEIWDGDSWLNKAISGDATLAATGALSLANDSVAAAEIAANAVGSSEMADNAIGTAEITDGTVAAADLADTGNRQFIAIMPGSLTPCTAASDTPTGVDVVASKAPNLSAFDNYTVVFDLQNAAAWVDLYVPPDFDGSIDRIQMVVASATAGTATWKIGICDQYDDLITGGITAYTEAAGTFTTVTATTNVSVTTEDTSSFTDIFDSYIGHKIKLRLRRSDANSLGNVYFLGLIIEY